MDKEITRLCLNDDTRHYGFNLLVKHYGKQLYMLARRMVIDHDDANDVVQNIFLKAWESLGQFREDSKIGTWLYRIAVNESLQFLRRKKILNFMPFNTLESKLSNSLKDDHYFSGNQIQMKLQKAILKLPEKQRLVFNMRYFDELPYEEMSEILGTSQGALKASYHHALKKIEKNLTDD